ncbi:hypothetical protein ACLKA7_013573 [Drosophila subpalustris]
MRLFGVSGVNGQLKTDTARTTTTKMEDGMQDPRRGQQEEKNEKSVMEEEEEEEEENKAVSWLVSRLLLTFADVSPT